MNRNMQSKKQVCTRNNNRNFQIQRPFIRFEKEQLHRETNY